MCRPTPKFASGFGDYNLMFDTVGGVANQSAEIEGNNAPLDPDNWDNVYSVFITDQWRLGGRLTFNLGTRIDQQHSFVPEQTRAAGEWTPAATFPRVEVGRWTSLAPRVAVAWDVTGSGRSVLKSTYGWFNSSTDISADYNQYTVVLRPATGGTTSTATATTTRVKSCSMSRLHSSARRARRAMWSIPICGWDISTKSAPRSSTS